MVTGGPYVCDTQPSNGRGQEVVETQEHTEKNNDTWDQTPKKESMKIGSSGRWAWGPAQSHQGAGRLALTLHSEFTTGAAALIQEICAGDRAMPFQ